MAHSNSAFPPCPPSSMSPTTHKADYAATYWQRFPRSVLASKPAQRALLRDYTFKFSLLPLEIVHMIVAIAAEMHVTRQQRWVALSLACVCREFKVAAEPLLIHTVRITETNRSTVWLQALKGRFKRTRVLISDGNVRSWLSPALFSSVEWFALHTENVAQLELERWPDLAASFHPRAIRVNSTSRAAEDYDSLRAVLLRLASVTHLHMHNCTWEVFALRTERIRFLIIDPYARLPFGLGPQSVASIVSGILRDMPKLERILVRTPFVRDDARAQLLDGLLDASVNFPGRIWVDDTVPFARDPPRMTQLEIDDERAGLDLYYSGRQLA